MRKLPASNKLYENLYPEVHSKIIWYKEKSEWLKDFNICLCIKNITPVKIIKALNLNPVEYKNYSEYLYNSVKLLRDMRRKRSIEVRNIQKENKKAELKNLIKLKNTTHKNWSWKYIADLMSISAKHLRRLRNDIEIENQNKYLADKINVLKTRIEKYINTKRLIKEIGYNNIDKKELGNINHINKLIKQYDIENVKLLYTIFNCNISFIIQMSSFYKAGQLNSKLFYLLKDKSNVLGNCCKYAYELYSETEKIFRLIDKYKI